MRNKYLGADAAAVDPAGSIECAGRQVSNDEIVTALVLSDYRIKLRVLAMAQALAWNDLPRFDQNALLRQAEDAYTKELIS